VLQRAGDDFNEFLRLMICVLFVSRKRTAMVPQM